MSLSFRLRDVFVPPESVVGEAWIGRGDRVLDYGCGPGSYAFAAAKLVGGLGEVYALDINPLAVRRVKRLAAKRGLANVVTIRSASATGLVPASVDIALLYDVLHDLEAPKVVLGELHRVLRPKGRLSVSDHHMSEAEIMGEVTAGGSFAFLSRGKRTYTFTRGE